MANFAIVEDNKVVNIAVSDFPLEGNWHECNDEIRIGDSLVHGVLVPQLSREDYERIERDHRLVTEVDPIAGHALRWASLPEEERLALATYRQALLDVPEQEGFPENVIWPTL